MEELYLSETSADFQLICEYIEILIDAAMRNLSEIPEFYWSLHTMHFKLEYPTFLWYSGQNSWLHTQKSRVRFSGLPDVLRNIGSGTGSTQPREDK
jgi:hypothetical protein